MQETTLMSVKPKLRAVFPIDADLEQQCRWCEKHLKPYLLQKPIGYWQDHSDEYQRIVGTMNFIVQALIAERSMQN